MRRLRFLFALAVLLMPFSAWGAFNQGTGAGGSVDISDVTGLGSGVLSPLQTQAGIVGGFPTIGSTANGDCVEWGASGTLLSTGAACGGGSGTVSSGTIGQLAQYAASGTTVSGLTLGTGVLTALQDAIGSTGGFPIIGGVLGTPSSGVATNLTGLPLTSGVTGVLPPANGGAVTSVGNWINPVISDHASGLNLTGLGSINSGSNALTLQYLLNFVNGDSIEVVGAGVSGGNLITNVTSGGGTINLVLAANAGTTVVGPAGNFVFTLGSITSGQATLTVANTAGWIAGEGIDVAGAGPAGVDLITTVQTVTSGTVLTLAINAATTVTNAKINHDDTAALLLAFGSGSNVQLPIGQFNITSALSLLTGQWVNGSGMVLLDFGGVSGGSQIWNRSKTINTLTMSLSGQTATDFAILQAPDITPTAGYGLVVGSGNPSVFIVAGKVNRVGVVNTFQQLHIIDGVEDWQITDDIFYGGVFGVSTAMVVVDNPSPAGDTKWNGTSISNQTALNRALLQFLNADTDVWTGLKFNGCGPCIISASGSVNNQNFVGDSFEGSGVAGEPVMVQISGGSNWLFTGDQFGLDQGSGVFSISGSAGPGTITGNILENNISGPPQTNTSSNTNWTYAANDDKSQTSFFPGVVIANTLAANLNLGIGSVNISALPTCNSGAAGSFQVVNNGVASPTFHQAVGGTTGAGIQPVFCNGTAWIYI